MLKFIGFRTQKKASRIYQNQFCNVANLRPFKRFIASACNFFIGKNYFTLRVNI